MEKEKGRNWPINKIFIPNNFLAIFFFFLNVNEKKVKEKKRKRIFSILSEIIQQNQMIHLKQHIERTGKKRKH